MALVLIHDRAPRLARMRETIRLDYDDQADMYDVTNSPIDDTHARFASAVVDSCPRGGPVLDAACGTGRYFVAALARDLRVTGTDQSPSMVITALQKDSRARAAVVSLQEIHYSQEFDAVLVIDAMEHVPPEDWPVILANLHRAVRTGGHLYVTVECTGAQGVADAYATALGAGLPVGPVNGSDEAAATTTTHRSTACARGWTRPAWISGRKRTRRNAPQLQLPPLPRSSATLTIVVRAINFLRSVNRGGERCD